MRATPRTIQQGIEDLSIKPVIIPETAYGQHLIKAFIMAAKGKYGRQILSGPEAIALYGAETFDKTSPFFNHSTLFAKKAMETSTVVLERIDMGGTSAGNTLYLDVATVDGESITKRQPTGEKDPLGEELATSTVHRLRLVTMPGEPVIQEGTMDNGGTKSTMYPLFTFKTDHGSAYNDLGFSINPRPDVAPEDIAAVKQFIYEFTSKRSYEGTTLISKTIAGSAAAKCGLVSTIDPVTEQDIGLQAVYEDSYSNTIDRAVPWKYTDAEITVHEANIKTVATILYSTESEFVKANAIVDNAGNTVDLLDWYDFDASVAGNDLLLNILSAKSTLGVDYLTFYMDETSEVTNVDYTFQDTTTVGNTATTFMFTGGTDFSDDLTTPEEVNDKFESVVRIKMQGYIDPNSELQEIALNPESSIYDSGYSVDTKKELCNFIGLRKDTLVTLSTYVWTPDGKNVMTEEDEIAIGSILKGRLLLNPESVHFSTKVARGIICGGSCTVAGSDYKGRVPTTYSLLAKASQYMGAGDRKWKTLFEFDSGDASAATEIQDILPKFTPPSIKGKLWATGINWVEPLYNEKVYHWPAFATVADDNSSLNSIFSVYAAMWIEKQQVMAWKYFSGESRLSPAAFKDKVEGYMRDRLKDAFGERFLLAPKVVFTEEDKALGYQWHLNTRIGVNDMYTVVVTSTTVVRKDQF